MRRLPREPYLENILKNWYDSGNELAGTDEYIEYLKTFGFVVPVQHGKWLDFPDDFDDRKLVSFIMRWS